MKIAILGYGVEGKSVEAYFKKHGDHQITIYDPITPADISELPLSDFNLIFRSPSIHPIKFSDSHDNTHRFTSSTRFFFDKNPAPIIGVTGTKGKGTTSSLIAALLKSLGFHTHLLGNIGTPVLDILDNIKPTDIVVYEMSSFQLWDLEKSPHVSVVLRIEPDHLDVHDDFNDYVSAKSNIAKHQSSEDYCIFYQDNIHSQAIADTSSAIKIPYRLSNNIKLNQILDNLKIPGDHNRENAIAAITAVAAFMNLKPDTFIDKYKKDVISTLSNFHGLPHRLEYLTTINSVDYYDDNYSSAFPALDVAISAFSKRPLFLIAGGKNRNLDLSNLISRLNNAKNLQKVFLIGETRHQIAKKLPKEKYHLCDDLESAVLAAKTHAENFITKTSVRNTSASHPSHSSSSAIYPVVLMSPGAASFDMFKNFSDRGEKFTKIVGSLTSFRFLSYHFNPKTYTAEFSYQGLGDIIFTEKITFAKTDPTKTDILSRSSSDTATSPNLPNLDAALFLSFILIGTSYYKACPTRNIVLDFPLSPHQANFFTKVYTDGLSQFIFENNLNPKDIASFTSTTPAQNTPTPVSFPSTITPPSNKSHYKILTLQSGGKDSLLTAILLKNLHLPFTAWHLTAADAYPQVLDRLIKKTTPLSELKIAHRSLDIKNLTLAKTKHPSLYKNGHIPITYINQSLALVQAILLDKNTVLTSIGQEGNEPHAEINGLKINHQWSKTWEAERLFADYVKTEISPNFYIGSPLRAFTELKIAELFVKNCWKDYGHLFSSCNLANYRQSQANSRLTWCGNCPKCANSYLLFAPFLPKTELDKIFQTTPKSTLFEKPSLLNTWKGLLGIGDVIKPFECIGEIDELRAAYHLLPLDLQKLPFLVPTSNFDKERPAATQPFIHKLFVSLHQT